MQRVIKLIRANEPQFPECAKYYVPLIGKARRNLVRHPDISIETCKALLEGISKTVLMHTKPEWSRHQIENMKFVPLITHAMQDLRENDDVVEDQFKGHVVSFGRSLATLRNHRSDISHGRGAPKEAESSKRFAALCFQTTEAVALYMLESYFERRAAAVDEPEDEAEEPLPGGIPDIGYEDFPAFNEELDAQYPLDGKLLYSDALYRLYYGDYVIELESYLDGLVDSAEALDEQVDGDTD